MSINTTISTDIIAKRYTKEGYCIVENLLSNEELQILRERTQDIIERRVDYPADSIEFEPDIPVKNMRKLNHCAKNDAVFRAHASHDKIITIVEALIGKDIKLFDSQAFLKPPGGIEKPYHQDSAYFAIQPMSLVTCWTALDDVTIENGCLWVIPGSHRQGLVDHSVRWMVGDREDKRIPDHAIDRRAEQPIVMPAGSCSFHHSLLMHSSRPNKTAESRRGLAMHYMSSRSRWCQSDQEEPDFVLIRGREYSRPVRRER